MIDHVVVVVVLAFSHVSQLTERRDRYLFCVYREGCNESISRKLDATCTCLQDGNTRAFLSLAFGPPPSSRSSARGRGVRLQAETASLEQIARELFLEIADCRRVRPVG